LEIPIILRRLLALLICLASIALLAGCSGGGKGVGATPILTRIRVINLVPNAPSIQVQLDTNAPFITGLSFEQLTNYIVVQNGPGAQVREFKVSADGGQTNVIDVSMNLLPATDYTFVVFGPVEAINQALALDTNNTIPNGGTFNLRLINVATGVRAVDLYLTAPGVDLGLTAPAIPNIVAGATSLYANVSTGTYEMRATLGGTKEVIYDALIGDFFPDKTVNEVIVFGKGSANLVNAAALHIDTDGTGQVFDSSLAAIKVLNGTSLGAAINVFVDGVLTLANVPFAGVSNYQFVQVGERLVTVQSASTPGADLLSLVLNLTPATDTSIAVSGPAGALQALVLNDNNLPSAINRARVRFVNASSDLAAMDVYVNFVKTFTNVASNAASPYAEILADATGTTYEFDFNIAGTVTPVLKLPGVTLTSGKTYTIYVVGPAAAPQGVVSLDD
jgi:hypothetical protein